MTEQELLRIIDLATSIKAQHDLIKEAQQQAKCAELELQNIMSESVLTNGTLINQANYNPQNEDINPYTFDSFRYKAFKFLFESTKRIAKQKHVIPTFTLADISRAVFGSAGKRNIGRTYNLIYALQRDDFISDSPVGPGWFFTTDTKNFKQPLFDSNLEYRGFTGNAKR